VRKSLSLQASLSIGALLICLHCFAAHAPAQQSGLIQRRIKVVGATESEIKAGKNNDVRLWAIVIGVSNFKCGNDSGDITSGNDFSIRNLKSAADDAQAIYDFLRSPEGGGFRDESEGGHMILLKDEQATKAKIDLALKKLEQAKPDDFFVIFLASHGMLLPQKDARNNSIQAPYFLLHDTEPKLSNASQTAMSMDLFGELIRQKKIPARKGLILTDTCHSGGIQMAGRAGEVGSLYANSRYIEEMNKVQNEGIGFIWAAGQLEASLENAELGHGYFTQCLIDGLSGMADYLVYDEGNKEFIQGVDGKVTFWELANYVKDEVARQTEDKQHPGFNTTSVEFNRVSVAVVPYASDIAGSAPVGTLVIRAPDVEGVEVAVDGHRLDGKLDGGMQRAIKIREGQHQLTFTWAGKSVTRLTQVRARRSTKITVNLAFSEGDEESLLETSANHLNVYLAEDKEPTRAAKELFDRGVESFNKQRFKEAMDLFTKAIQANNGAYSRAFVLLGRTQQSLGDDKAAVNSFQKAIELKPSDYEAETLLAEAKLDSDYNIEEIEKGLKAITRAHPDYDFARVVYGELNLLQNNLREAERQLTRALQITPKNPAASMILADVLINAGVSSGNELKMKQAVEQAKRAVILFDELSVKKKSLATGLRRLSITHVIFGGGRFVNEAAMAEANFIAADTITRWLEAKQSMADGGATFDEARRYIQEGIKYAQGLTDKRRLTQLFEVSARIYLSKGDAKSAIKEGEQALKFAETTSLKDYYDAHLTLARAYNSEQKFAAAEKHMKSYLTQVERYLTAAELQRKRDFLSEIIRKKEASGQR
jgi:tetratricopeptide (TPR) repeat protein